MLKKLILLSTLFFTSSYAVETAGVASQALITPAVLQASLNATAIFAGTITANVGFKKLLTYLHENNKISLKTLLMLLITCRIIFFIIRCTIFVIYSV